MTSEEKYNNQHTNRMADDYQRYQGVQRVSTPNITYTMKDLQLYSQTEFQLREGVHQLSKFFNKVAGM